jgi:hypothetical protein
MVRPRSIVVLLTTAGVVTLAALAQTPPTTRPSPSEVKKQFAAMIEKTTAPTDQHKLLAAFVGEFDVISDVQIGAGEPMKAHSLSQGQWIMGGRFVKVENKSAPDEELKGERLITYGYDPQTGKYTMCNIDSMSLTAATAQGNYDAASKTFTLDGQREQPGAGPVPFRWVLQVQESGVLVQTILMKPAGAADFVPIVTAKHTPKSK